jgi:hypothetical protein
MMIEHINNYEYFKEEQDNSLIPRIMLTLKRVFRNLKKYFVWPYDRDNPIK